MRLNELIAELQGIVTSNPNAEDWLVTLTNVTTGDFVEYEVDHIGVYDKLQEVEIVIK
jgi:hypothetical protein